MRILFLTQYFPPETGAAQNRLSDLAARLAAAGHEVVVLTALPSYPKGEIFDGYRGRFVVTEDEHPYRIVRIWTIVTKNKDFLRRMLNYLSFAILALIVGTFKVAKTDVLYVESPPLFLAVSGFILGKLKQAKFVLNVSDLWPESAIALGILRNSWLIRLATRVEEELYHRASLITGQTQGIIDSIRSRCPQTAPLLLTNGVSPEFLRSVEVARGVRERTRKEFRFGSRLIAAYTGVHGLAQGLDAIICAAEILKEHEGIQFLFLGDGPEKTRLQAAAIDKKLNNVRFLDTEPSSRMPEMLTAIDISLVVLKRHDLFRGALPSKLFEAMGAGVPVIVGIDGEARSLVELSGGGLVVEPDNPGELARAVLLLHGDPALRQSLGARGRAYIREFYNREKITQQLERSLTHLTAGQEVVVEEGKSPTGLESSEDPVEVAGPYNKQKDESGHTFLFMSF
jgi:glycosyltransferase involved in cell wall biosynthesis